MSGTRHALRSPRRSRRRTPLAPQGARNRRRRLLRPQPAATSPLNFSGVIFGSYNYQLPTTQSPPRNQINNVFVLDRAYLNFRMRGGRAGRAFASPRTSFRARTRRATRTPSARSTPTCSTRRRSSSNGAQVTGRIGILQNVVIEHTDTFWPRYLSQAATERAGYFSSADVGIAGLFTLPSRWGEVYATDRERAGLPGARARPVQGLRRASDAHAAGELAGVTRSSRPSRSRRGATRAPRRAAFVNGGTGQAGRGGRRARPQPRRRLRRPPRSPARARRRARAAPRRRRDRARTPHSSPRVETTITGRLLSGITVVRPLAFSSEPANRRSASWRATTTSSRQSARPGSPRRRPRRTPTTF